MDYTLVDLFAFINEAGKATYAGGGKYVKPERPEFLELTYSRGDFFYRDSYAGFYRSRGTEVVRWKGKPIWSALYGGGMAEGQEALALETFKFLKKALSNGETGFKSFRGPHNISYGEWEYKYSQAGDVTEFSGFEEISYRGKTVFTHRIIGGLIIDKK